jgi:L-alanine-DL-glutamate epimerase-like enolase superfamily enzyme
MGRFTAWQAWRLRLPLEKPYRLAFGPVEALDTVVVRMAAGAEDGAGDGRGHGYGEATLLTGYTDETIDDTWRETCRLVGAAATPGFDLFAALDQLDAPRPFLATAFRTAAEMAGGSPLLTLHAPARVPILGLLQGDTPAQLESEVESLLAHGYRTLKLKVGFDAASDAETVLWAQRAVAGRARLRLDANQGYGAAAAVDFVRRLSPESIELFEQPCAAGDWEAHAAVLPIARDRGIALMLDESIYAERDIERAAALGAAAFIKVKLMKFCTLERLAAAIGRIRELGMEPVLGNGVATDLGCWMEACVAARHICNAGEMNGFLKPRSRLLADTLVFREGAIDLPARWRPRIDRDTLDRLALDTTGPPGKE